MYLGRIVELGPADEFVRAPLHPYTEALLRAIPIADPRRMRVRDLGLTEGEAASPMNAPAGCAFHQRCGRRMPVCAQRVPPFSTVALGRATACFLHIPH
jgi:oligopeptide/dipeptide ABC transporter ATP-binding protein